jgi:hypothetical protein
MIELRKNVSVVLECEDRKYRVIDNLRQLVGTQTDRNVSESTIGRRVLDLARKLEIGADTGECDCGSHPLAPLYHRTGCPKAFKRTDTGADKKEQPCE